MRLLSFEQLFFWYYIIENLKGSFLKVILDTDILSKFMCYYYKVCDLTVEEKYRKRTGAGTIYNHFGHFATFYKWFLSLKDYAEEKKNALQAYYYCTLEAKSIELFLNFFSPFLQLGKPSSHLIAGTM